MANKGGSHRGAFPLQSFWGITRVILGVLITLAATSVSGCKYGPFSTDRTALQPVSVTVDDPLYSQQWYLPLINAEAAWQRVADHQARRGTISPVVVAVIDSLVDRDHEDLRGVLVPGTPLFISNASDADLASDTHGTHVAGLAGAQGNNGLGIVGASYNGFPGTLVRIEAIAALKGNNGGGTVADVANAILYAAGLENFNGDGAREPARVINLSLGAPALNADEKALLHDVIRMAAERDILLVAAAGNETSGPAGRSVVDFPARFPEVMAIGAVTESRDLSWYSHHGPDLELVAPGGGGAERGDEPGRKMISTYPDDGYGEEKGTSMATPLVAGVAALVRSVNPDLTASQVRAVLQDTATDLGDPGWDDRFGYGLLNADAAVGRAIGLAAGEPWRRRSLASQRATPGAAVLDAPAGTRDTATPWDPQGSRAIGILVDPAWVEQYRAGPADEAAPMMHVKRSIREQTGLETVGTGLILRITVPDEIDGEDILRAVRALEFVRSAVQDRAISWR